MSERIKERETIIRMRSQEIHTSMKMRSPEQTELVCCLLRMRIDTNMKNWQSEKKDF